MRIWAGACLGSSQDFAGCPIDAPVPGRALLIVAVEEAVSTAAAVACCVEPVGDVWLPGPLGSIRPFAFVNVAGTVALLPEADSNEPPANSRHTRIGRTEASRGNKGPGFPCFLAPWACALNSRGGSLLQQGPRDAPPRRSPDPRNTARKTVSPPGHSRVSRAEPPGAWVNPNAEPFGTTHPTLLATDPDKHMLSIGHLCVPRQRCNLTFGQIRIIAKDILSRKRPRCLSQFRLQEKGKKMPEVGCHYIRQCVRGGGRVDIGNRRFAFLGQDKHVVVATSVTSNWKPPSSIPFRILTQGATKVQSLACHLDAQNATRTNTRPVQILQKLPELGRQSPPHSHLARRELLIRGRSGTRLPGWPGNRAAQTLDFVGNPHCQYAMLGQERECPAWRPVFLACVQRSRCLQGLKPPQAGLLHRLNDLLGCH